MGCHSGVVRKLCCWEDYDPCKPIWGGAFEPDKEMIQTKSGASPFLIVLEMPIDINDPFGLWLEYANCIGSGLGEDCFWLPHPSLSAHQYRLSLLEMRCLNQDPKHW